MTTTTARGWTADWLNGWLAAIGATVLVPELRLSWTDEPRPAALLHGPDEVAARIYEALPSVQHLETCSAARDLDGYPRLTGKISTDDFALRAAHARRNSDWSLGVLTTDLAEPGKRRILPPGQFNVPYQGEATLPSQIVRCRSAITGVDIVHGSLVGQPQRAAMAGTGFDSRRLKNALAGESHHQVDPVVEVLVWEALSLFPVSVRSRRVRSRKWTGSSRQPGAFTWGVWHEALDRWAIDALLDLGWPTGQVWEVVPLRPPPKSKDVTSAFASRRVRDD